MFLADRVVALVGNPNVGKSTVFNSLTGLRQHTGNWPGKTVAVATGSYTYCGETYTIIDLPGTYSLDTRSAEEEVTRDFVESGGACAVIVVCDATCLERSLILALQTRAAARRVLLCVNLYDEAQRKGVRLDLQLLSEMLGLPVVATDARKGAGLDKLMECIAEACAEVEKPSCPRDCGPACACRRTGAAQGEDVSSPRGLVREAERIASKCVLSENGGYSPRDRRVDKLLTGRVTGPLFMLVLLCVVFYITLAGANYPSELLSRLLFGLEARLGLWLRSVGAPEFAVGLLVDGSLRVLFWVVSVMLPPMAIFFPMFTLLEELGYLPRVAFNLDRAFQRCRACGKQSLTMCMGFGCNAAGVVGCRIIDSPRERLIAILTNCFVPCNGRFPMMITLIGAFLVTGSGSVLPAFALAGIIVLGVGMTLLASRILSATLLRGVPSDYLLELPPYRRPLIGRVILRSILDRTIYVLGRAAAVAAPAGALIWLMANVTAGGRSLLLLCSGALDPFARVFGLDGVILMSFILAFPANEIVMPLIIMGYTASGSLASGGGLAEARALLAGTGWTWVTALCTLLFSLMHWPCSTTCLTIRRETGSLWWTFVAMALPTLFGLACCFLVNLVLG